MRVFVTGGAGLIGSNFIRYVLARGKGYQVVNYDKLTYASSQRDPPDSIANSC
jgi:dTDP-glucose 4,6-dehydratase